MKTENQSEIVTLNVPLLRSTHRRLLEIQTALGSANLSLALQRVIMEFRTPKDGGVS